jgi:hypothetical protein
MVLPLGFIVIITAGLFKLTFVGNELAAKKHLNYLKLFKLKITSKYFLVNKGLHKVDSIYDLFS